jgi:hypothetical protein
MLAGELAGHPQPVGLLLQELAQMIAGECALGRPKNLRDLRLMREEVETLGRRVKNAVDMGTEQWPMANCEETLDRVCSLRPNIVAIVIEDDTPPPMRCLAARRIQGRQLNGLASTAE